MNCAAANRPVHKAFDEATAIPAGEWPGDGDRPERMGLAKK
jgi:hypothetical protein